MLFGDGSAAAMAAAEAAKNAVRTTDHFNWTFIALLAVVGYKIIKGEYNQIKYFRELDIDDRKKQEGWFFAANAGLLFYLMTYFKSYSIYDGYQLFIFIAFMIHSDMAFDDIYLEQEQEEE